jgi:3-methyladenine DNA glycosylase Tag
MKKFKPVLEKAEKRKGGKKQLQAFLPEVLPESKLAKKSDDRFLAMMTKTINQAGFSWKVIENKWPQFEQAFLGFDPRKLSLLSPEQWENYVKDTRVVRNWQKIKAVKDNVVFMLAEAREHGSFAKFIAQWPSSDLVGLLLHLKKHGSRLGGNTGQRFLRYVGKDGFVLSQDVIAALQQAGLEIADNPTSKRDLKKIQDAFNGWHDETGLPYAHLSKIASCSLGQNYTLADFGR